ncbi:putative sodium-coupled neutral amino acid transporter 10 [Pteropus vampyrus]|uniref:Sodium-coupled neutral amino acid transporter 10 n=1 Tax=Pteropus vampyrus TaxID=132908 RepID=A0A6P6D3Y0_PTEVA|nr:putative sodium-coupled neutral amino acid transporter 10 [Pteropus vampyrus]
MTAAAASNWGLIMNVVNSIVGVSVLTMPFCFKQWSIVWCTQSVHPPTLPGTAVFPVWSSVDAHAQAQSLDLRLSLLAYGRAGKVLVETSMIGLMLGTCIAFYVVIGDLGSNFFARLFGFQVTGTFRVLLLFVVSLCMVLPLSLQRNMMASIQSFSAMALIFYTMFMFVILLSSLKHDLFGGQWLHRVSYVRWEGVFRCIPIFGMSFACQSEIDFIPETWPLGLVEAAVRGSRPLRGRVRPHHTPLHSVLRQVGFFGYVSFTEAIAGNVLMHFPSNLVTQMVRAGFMMSVAVGFPMMILPCRQALNTLLFEQQQKDGTFAAGGYMPPLRFKALTLSVVFGTMVGGIMIPNVETILGLTGATMGSLICFICPALIYRKVHKNTLSSQVVLWVGLGILVVSTHTTLSVSEETPVNLDLAKEAPGGQLRAADGETKAEVARLPGTRLSGQKAGVAVAEDGRDKPKLPPEKDEMEQAQIKGPENVPQREGAKEKQEEVQLDRPAQGVAVPVGEAHRHEPPVPHDKVVVDEGQDREGPEEDVRSSKHVAEKAPGDKGQMVPPLPDSKRERPGQDQALEAVGALPQDPQKVPEGNGQPAVEPVKEDLELGNRGLHPGPQAELPEGQESLGAGAGERAAGIPGHAARAVGEPAESEPGGKLAPGAGQPAELRAQRDSEGPGGDHAGSRLEEAGRAEMLDHAVLLQVIKEQQVQQKRLLDQQEKLLAVIEEQHKEIRQQRQDGEDVDAQPEPGVAVSKSKEQEARDGGLAEHPLQPLEPELGAPGRPPSPPPGHDQRALEEPEAAAGGAPPGPPGGGGGGGGVDTEPRAAQAKPREGWQGTEPKEAGVQERAPEPGLAGAPGGPEKPDAGDSARQSQDNFGGGSHERRKPRKEVAAAGAAVQEAGALEGGVERPQQVGQDQDPAGLSRRLGAAAPQAQAVLHHPEHPAVSVGGQGGHPEARKEALGGDHLGGDNEPAPREDAPVPGPDQRPNPELGPKQAIPGAQKPDLAKPNRDLKVQAGSDLRRRRRDVAPRADGGLASDDGVIISFNSLPDVQVNDLRSALDTQLRQAAGGALHVVHSRQIKQLPGIPEEA